MVEYKTTDKTEGTVLAKIQAHRGERMRLTKIGMRREDGSYASIQPARRCTGAPSVVDCEGKACLFVNSISEWFCTSAIVDVREKTDGGLIVETLNSQYSLE